MPGRRPESRYTTLVGRQHPGLPGEIGAEVKGPAPGGLPRKHLQHQDGEMNNSDQRNEESG
jgi:hypothetical protein